MKALPRLAPCLALALPALAVAAGSSFTAGLDGGLGTLTDIAGTDTPFFLAFHGGWQVHERVNFGISAGGLLLQPSDAQNPEPGRGISELMLTASWRPLRGEPSAWLEAGAGRVTYWNNPQALATNLQGPCWRLSAGADTWHGTNWRSGPFLAYERGDAGTQEHRAWVVGLRMQWLLSTGSTAR